MADTTYKIAVDTAGAVSAINGLKTALGGLAAAFSVKALVQFSDDITNLRNKLLTLTPDLKVVEKQFQALAAIAIQARTPLEATSDLFFRIQRSAKALGISQQEAAQITESLAKAISASGLSANEAAGPLLQLGQALQSGTFQGDELRSILEGLPPVAQALADQKAVIEDPNAKPLKKGIAYFLYGLMFLMSIIGAYLKSNPQLLKDYFTRLRSESHKGNNALA